MMRWFAKCLFVVALSFAGHGGDMGASQAFAQQSATDKDVSASDAVVREELLKTQTAPERTHLTPLMERYILDEIKAIRIDLERLKADVRTEMADRENRLSTRAMEYSTHTVTFFFYVFAIIGTVLALLGWRSFADMKNAISQTAERELNRLSVEYEERLTSLENELLEKGHIILENQQEIEKTQTLHAFWLQANQTPDARSKIAIYDQILALDPKDYEAMAYKADAALNLGDKEWALSLCNRILDEQEDNSLAYYFRACALSVLELNADAMTDLQRALELSPGLAEQAREEEDFTNLREMDEFEELIGRYSSGE